MRISEKYFFHPTAFDIAGERVSVTTEDGTILVGRFLKHDDAIGTLIYFGGNEEFVDLNGKALQKLANFNLNVIMVDYRGYGASGGKPSLETFFKDSMSVYRYTKNMPEALGKPLLLYGFSLGGFAAAHVASQGPRSGLILEATGTSTADWASHVIPWYYKPFVRVEIAENMRTIDNVKKIKAYHGPLLVLAGQLDKDAPAPMSQKLFDASPSTQKQLHVFAIGKHGDIKEDQGFHDVFSDFTNGILTSNKSKTPK